MCVEELVGLGARVAGVVSVRLYFKLASFWGETENSTGQVWILTNNETNLEVV